MSYITLVEDPDIKTPSHRVHAFSNFDLEFSLHNGQQRVRLALEPNHDVLHPEFSVTTLNEDGSVREVERVKRHEHKVYRGSTFVQRSNVQGWSKAGPARVYIHEDGDRPVFDAAFRIDGDGHHVLPRSQYQSMRHEKDPVVVSFGDETDDSVMVVWRDSDVTEDDGDLSSELKRRDGVAESSVCNADALEFNNNYYDNVRRDLVDEENLSLRSTDVRSLFGRQIDDGGGDAGMNLISSIGSTAGCPTTKRVALVGIANDCNYYEAFNNDANAMQKQLVSVVNKASEVYESTFKISLAIRNYTRIDKPCTTNQVAPWNVKCDENTTSISDRLNKFSQWRGQSTDDNAYWTLFTTCPSGSAVGLAWRGMLCRGGSGNDQDGSGHNETVAATNVVVKTDTEWQIFAHETGHTFGAVHDCTDQTCPVSGTNQQCCPLSQSTCDAGSKYIMNPATGRGITQFSPCSIGNICSSLKSNLVKGTCLTDNRNVKTDLSLGAICGNGIVEEGEECDCGGDDRCTGNKCCDGKTCKFTSGSQCDPSNQDCCNSSCHFASNGTVCRNSTGECDIAETCPGDKAACPDDKHKDNGDSCGASGSGLECASGQCTSRDQQCQHMSSSLSGRNNTQACKQTNSDCLLACTSPDLGNNQCMTYNQNFVDGTSCGGGGHCSNGTCTGTSTAKEISNWIQNNKAIFIPVVSIVGALVLIALASCIYSAIKRRMRGNRAPPARPGPRPQMSNWPQQSEYMVSGARGGTRDYPVNPPREYPDHYGHQYEGVYPPPPSAGNNGRWNGGSMRYA